MIKTELKKVLRTKLFYISIGIGCVACLLGLISYSGDVSIYRQAGRSELISAYQGWLNCLAMGSSVYRLLLPLLIVPYLDSYYMERKNGYQNFVVTRCGRAKYFFSKWVAGILSAALIIGAVLIVTLVVCVSLYPGNAPLEENTYINYSDMKAHFMEHPLRFIILLIFMNILTSVIYYTFGLGMSCYAPNRYVVAFTPMAAYYICLFGSQILNVSALSPIAMVAPFELTGLSNSSVRMAAAMEAVMAILFLINCFRKDVTEMA